MSLGTVVSRATGVIRLAAMVAALGIAETRLTDTYNLANTAPNILYELVLGGVVGSVFVPLFVELLQNEDKDEAWRVFSGILNMSLLVLTGLAIVGVIASPWIARFYAFRLEGEQVVEQARVITFLLRLFIPQVVLYGLYFVLAALMNAHKRFGAPMFTPIVNNIVAIGVFVAFARLYGEVNLEEVTPAQLWLLGLGTTLSVAPMGLGLIPLVRRLGRYRFTLSLDHPALKKLARLSVYAIGFVLTNQIGYVVIQWLANEQQGGYSAYISAQTFFLLPIGLFVWSLTTAILPGLSEHSIDERWERFRELLSTGVRASAFLMLPCAVAYIVLGEHMVRVLLERGVVTGASTQLVADVLAWFALALVQFAMFQLFVRAFYAVQDTKTPFHINLLVIALITVLNFPLFERFGVGGLALSQAIAYTVGIGVQVLIVRRRMGGLETRRIAASVIRCGLAGLAMGAVLLGARSALPDAMLGGGITGSLGLALLVALGGVAYLAAARLLGVEELTYVRSILARRRVA